MPAPVCVAMVVCDSHYKDPFTNKHTLLGIFATLHGTSFPLVHPQLTVYVALSDGHGRTPASGNARRRRRTRTGVPVRRSRVEFTDPRSVIEICFATGVIYFPEPGEYRLKPFLPDPSSSWSKVPRIGDAKFVGMTKYAKSIGLRNGGNRGNPI